MNAMQPDPACCHSEEALTTLQHLLDRPETSHFANPFEKGRRISGGASTLRDPAIYSFAGHILHRLRLEMPSEC